VKRQTSYGKPVYQSGQEPDAELEKVLINRYWRPWHEKLAGIAADTRVKLVLDCHSMAAIGPTAYTDARPNQVRPRVSISNLGDWDGDSRTPDQRISADPHVTRMLAVQLGKNLDDVPTLASVGARSAVNIPYIGGYDIAAHGGRTQPWLMVEVNRALYVGPQTGDTPVTRPNLGLIDVLREQIWQAVDVVFKNHFALYEGS
jgi:formiminoglutamase